MAPSRLLFLVFVLLFAFEATYARGKSFFTLSCPNPCHINHLHLALARRRRRDDLTLGGGSNINLPFLNQFVNKTQSPLLNSIFSNTGIGQQTGASINLSNNQPRGSIGQQGNILGVFNQQKGIGGGVDPDGRIGGEWGEGFGILNNLFGFGKQGQAKVDLEHGNAQISENTGFSPFFQQNKGFSIDWGNLAETLKNGRK